MNSFWLCLLVIFVPIILLSHTTYAASSQASSTIPQWVKNNAKWWSEGQVGDSDFVKGIQYLVQNNIIQISQTQPSPNSGSQQIPQWIKNNAGWWSQGHISDDEFVKGIQYLISNGIMKIK